MLRPRANGETFVPATMCPRLPVPLEPVLVFRARALFIANASVLQAIVSLIPGA